MTRVEKEVKRIRLWDSYYAYGMTNVNMPTYEESLQRRAELTIRRSNIMAEIQALDGEVAVD